MQNKISFICGGWDTWYWPRNIKSEKSKKEIIELTKIAIIYRSAKAICRKCYCRLDLDSKICKKCHNTDLRKKKVLLGNYKYSINKQLYRKTKKLKK